MTRPEKLSEIAALIGQPDAERWYADRTDRQLDQLLTSLRGERGAKPSTLADVWQDSVFDVT